MGEGRHARFTVSSAGVRARAVAFGVGNSLSDVVGDGAAGGAARATTSPRASRSTSGPGRSSRGWSCSAVHPLPRRATTTTAAARTVHAARARSAGGTRSSRSSRRRSSGLRPCRAATARETVVDRRGEGVLGTLSRAAQHAASRCSSPAPTSRAAARSSRASSPPSASAGRAAICVSTRCARDSRRASRAASPGRSASPSTPRSSASRASPARFEHVFVLDPPPFAHVDELLREAAPAAAARASCTSAGAPPELEFSRQRPRARAARCAPRSRRSTGRSPRRGGTLAGDGARSGARGRRRAPPKPRSCGALPARAGRARPRRRWSAQALPLDARSRVKSGSSWSARARFAPMPARCEEGLRFLSEQTPTTEGRGNGRASRRARTGAAGGVAGATAPTTAARPRRTPHVRVGVIETHAPAGAPPTPSSREGLCRSRSASCSIDLFAVIEEHADDAVQPVDKARVARGVPLLLRAPRRPAAQVRRGLHHPPGRRREDLRGHAPRHRDDLRGAAARHGRGHERVARGRRRPRSARRSASSSTASRSSPASRSRAATSSRPRTTAR